MSAARVNASRLRRGLAKHAAGGWQQAVFARPGAPDDASAHPGREGAPTAEQVDALVDAAIAAAQAGRVKQTLVIDAGS